MSDSFKPKRIAIPKVADPFVNTRLVSVGADSSGMEHFWTSTWNSTSGCTGILINENGKLRLCLRFPPKIPGLYSAVCSAQNELWLCGMLDHVVHVDISSGRHIAYPTGAPVGLVFQGMCFDPATKKLLAIAFTNSKGTCAFSFDTLKKQSVRVYENLPGNAHYMRFNFPNGDGTYSMVVHCPRQRLYHWDPRRETVEPWFDFESLGKGVYAPTQTVGDERNRWYVPRAGWFDPARRRITAKQPQPEREASWFGIHGGRIYGLVGDKHGGVPTCVCWDPRSGAVKTLCGIPDLNMAYSLSAKGDFIAVTQTGGFRRHHGQNGALECAAALNIKAVQRVDCLCRLGKDRLLGTPFITQRFWEADLRTRKGQDCGRAAPGCGEVLKIARLHGKLFMAAYGGGTLMEYDPKLPPRYPENPRLVAQPVSANRPIAMTSDGRRIFYSCSAPYGSLGSVVTRYDTRTGSAGYANNLLPLQKIGSIWWSRKTRSLICGTDISGDCDSALPRAKACCVARLDPDTLTPVETADAPRDTQHVSILGPLGKGLWHVIAVRKEAANRPRQFKVFALDENRLAIPEWDDMSDSIPGSLGFLPARRIGQFVIHFADRMELWDLRRRKILKTLHRGGGVYNYHVQDRSVYLIRNRDILILDNCLP